MPEFTRRELERLQQIRSVLLGMESRPEGTDAPAYWSSEEDIRLYDEVYAQRIRWKWNAVLREMELRAQLPAPRTILDWGCGTGIATRAVLDAVAPPERVVLFDRSEAVLRYAQQSLSDDFPGVTFEAATKAPDAESFDLVLASHVLDELSQHDELTLQAAMRAAHDVLWVEPGTKITSRRLGRARDALLDTFNVVAPCTHRGACPVLVAGRESDWCHMFAKPPGIVHTTAKWTAVGKQLGIDLRSLPYSFVALTRREVTELDSARVLGRPRLLRGRALVDLCSKDGYEREAQLLKRTHKDLLREFKKPSGDPILLDKGRQRIPLAGADAGLPGTDNGLESDADGLL